MRGRGLGIGFVRRERGKEGSFESGVNFRLLPLFGIVRGSDAIGAGWGWAGCGEGTALIVDFAAMAEGLMTGGTAMPCLCEEGGRDDIPTVVGAGAIVMCVDFTGLPAAAADNASSNCFIKSRLSISSLASSKKSSMTILFRNELSSPNSIGRNCGIGLIGIVGAVGLIVSLSSVIDIRFRALFRKCEKKPDFPPVSSAFGSPIGEMFAAEGDATSPDVEDSCRPTFVGDCVARDDCAARADCASRAAACKAKVFITGTRMGLFSGFGVSSSFSGFRGIWWSERNSSPCNGLTGRIVGSDKSGAL